MPAQTEMNPSQKRPSRPVKHSLEFKISIARKVIEQGKSQAELARETGIAITNIHKWVHQGRRGQLPGYTSPAFNAATGDLAAEVRRLERELHQVRQERDFLKKCSVFFATKGLL